MKDYSICTDLENEHFVKAAETLRNMLCEYAGHYPDIAGSDKESDGSIVICRRDADSDAESFKVTAKNGRLVIECAYDCMAEIGVSAFVKEKVSTANGSLDFSGTVFTKDISHIAYEDFGAAGDGVTDDFQAIYNAHIFANENSLSVRATDKKTYYLHDSNIKDPSGKSGINHIPVKTNVDWGSANFIIDDSDINFFNEKEKAQTDVFVVEPDTKKIVLTGRRVTELAPIGCSCGTEKIDLGLGYPAMIVVYDSGSEVYKRYGSTYDGSGMAKHELIVIDKDGNVDPSTPFMFDYERITSVEVIRLDIKPLTIKGGNFTTRACRCDALITIGGVEKKAGYYFRGLQINRSGVTVENVNHLVEGEVTLEEYKNGLEGAHYNGFFYAKEASGVTLKNCIMTGRRYYRVAGTYEFGANLVNNIVLDGCVQRNFWVTVKDGRPSDVDTGRFSMDPVDVGDGRKVQYCWGIGGTDFCKNMNYINSRLSRFDAHCGLYNGSVVNCEMNFFEIIGKGTFLIKDTTWYSSGQGATYNSLIYLRDDYGATWEGDFIFDRVSAYVSGGEFYVFRHRYVDWDFGYKCHIPNVEINDLKLYSIDTRSRLDPSCSDLFLFTDDLSTKKAPYMHEQETDSKKNNNPIGRPEHIKINGNEGAHVFKVPYSDDRRSFFAGVDFYVDGEAVPYEAGIHGAFNFYENR